MRAEHTDQDAGEKDWIECVPAGHVSQKVYLLVCKLMVVFNFTVVYSLNHVFCFFCFSET